VVFVADAFGTWLVEQLADAGRKKLTELFLGSEQERALQRVADVAVWATAKEVSPSGGEQAGQVAMVISEVFRDPAPAVPLAGPVMLLEGLRARIATQLAVLDDPELTGTGQSSSDVLGVPGSVLVDRLTDHLVREIIVDASGGGPLTPLADQFNHELTRLQIEGMFARLAGEVRGALTHSASHMSAVGWPLDEVTDAYVLEVHRPVQPEDPPSGLPELSAYVRREHDTTLGTVVQAAADGRSGIAVLVGGSSTGKTRACWEALQLLRDRPQRWRLWHPIDPTRPDAALRELPGIGPRTVVWLNEAQFYLDVAEGGLGERVAAGLRELLRHAYRGPVLVLATLWPEFWDALTARHPSGPDPHAQARELLAGQDIAVPAAFTAAELGQLTRATDARLALAAAGAQDGEVIQFLAGAPELLARYRNAPTAAAALVNAAMDTRRLGMGIGLPQAFLEAAAPGYLTDAEWDALGGDWLAQALSYTAVPCKGVRGPLTRIRPRPAGPGSPNSDDRPSAGHAGTGGGPLYRLADYLDQYGRAHRKNQIPPAGFWAAAADYASPADQAALGDAADDRGLYKEAAQLHKNAAAHGSFRSASYLSHPPGCLRADPRPAHWGAAHIALGDPRAVTELLDSLREAEAHEQAATLLIRAAASMPLHDPAAVAHLLDDLREPARSDQKAALLARDPAAHVALNDPLSVVILLDSLNSAGARQQEAALLARDPAVHVALDDWFALHSLLRRLRQAGAHEQAATLLARAAARTPGDDPYAEARLLRELARLPGTDAHELAAALLVSYPVAEVPLDSADVAWLLGSLRDAGGDQQAAALASRAAADMPLDDPADAARLLGSLREAALDDQEAALLARDPAARVVLDDPGDVAWLLNRLRRAGAREQEATLLARDPAAHVALDDPFGVASLLSGLRAAGARQQAAALAKRAAADLPLDDPRWLSVLLESLREVGAYRQAAALARRAAADMSLHYPTEVAWFLKSLREASRDELIAVLLARDPAAHVTLDDPAAVFSLQEQLGQAGAHEQVMALAERIAADAPLDDPAAVAELLGSLEKLGTHQQVTALAERAAADVPLDNPAAVAQLLDSLRAAGARQQFIALAERAIVADAPLGDSFYVRLLMYSLREAGRHQQAATLAERLPAAGRFSLYLEMQGQEEWFRFGREADGRPSAPWGWENLD
jgi:hypothetical protein